MRTKWWLCLGVSSMILSGCTTVPRYNPYKVGKQEIIERVNKIGIMPVFMAFNFIEGKEKQNFFNTELAKAFEGTGLEVVPPSEWTKISEVVRDELGDLFDPKTGVPKKEKVEQLRKTVRERYQTKFNVDAFVLSGLKQVKVNWNRNDAYWDGTYEATTGREGFWARARAPQATGTIGALSLWVRVEAPDAQPLFEEAGGLQLTQHVRGTKFIPVAPQDLLADEKVNRHAIELATCRFIEIWSLDEESEYSCRD